MTGFFIFVAVVLILDRLEVNVFGGDMVKALRRAYVAKRKR